MSINTKFETGNHTNKLYFLCQGCGMKNWFIVNTYVKPITKEDLYCDLCMPEWGIIMSINKGKLNDWREKLRKHIIVIANNPKDYDTYNKGWCAGQMDLLNSILKDEE